jgi:hypothetical protein
VPVRRARDRAVTVNFLDVSMFLLRLLGARQVTFPAHVAQATLRKDCWTIDIGIQIGDFHPEFDAMTSRE